MGTPTSIPSANTSSSDFGGPLLRSGNHQPVCGGDDIGDGADVPMKILRLNALAGKLLQLNGEIDGVDAVEIEVGNSCASGVTRAGSISKVSCRMAQFLEDVLVVHDGVVQ